MCRRSQLCWNHHYTALVLVCTRVFDTWLEAAFNSWLHTLNAGWRFTEGCMSISPPPPPQSLVSSCSTPGRSRSEEWTSTTRTTTTSSPSLCRTSTTWPWWTTMLWSTASTGPTCAPRASRELSLTALEWRLWSLLVRQNAHTILIVFSAYRYSLANKVLFLFVFVFIFFYIVRFWGILFSFMDLVISSKWSHLAIRSFQKVFLPVETKNRIDNKLSLYKSIYIEIYICIESTNHCSVQPSSEQQ